MKQVFVSVGMGPGQLGFIRRLKEKGLCVAAFGKGKNSDEAMQLSDYCAEIDTRDYEAAEEWLDSLGVEVIAIGSYSGGQAVRTVTKLSNYYKTATMIPDELICDSTKIGQQQMLEKYELSSIKTFKLDELERVIPEDSSGSLYVVKPNVGRGSVGVEIVNYANLKARYASFDESDAGTVVQSFRQGTEYRCVLVINEGQIKLLAPVKRISYKDTVFLGVLEYCGIHYNEIFAFFSNFVNRAHINNAIIKTDIIVSDIGIDVIEMDIGAGGGMYYKTYVSRLFDIDLMDEYINLVMGKRISSFSVVNPLLRMEYVYNHQQNPISYDYDKCVSTLESKFGSVEIIRNILEPEKKGGFGSNADFIFTVIRKKENGEKTENFEVDKFVNDNLFYGK